MSEKTIGIIIGIVIGVLSTIALFSWFKEL